MTVTLLRSDNFERTIDGKKTHLFTLCNKNGCFAQFSNYGARWLSMWVPDKEGKLGDVVLGFDELDKYLSASEKYYGAAVGRVCGRIDNGIFSLNNKVYHLAHNDIFGRPLKNHLHGGFKGFSFRVWEGRKEVNEIGEEILKLYYESADLEEGYPGNLKVEVVYTLTHENAIDISYAATTDKPTIINLTNHPYFNLNMDAEGDILEHRVMINAHRALECNEELIPTGRLIEIGNTPLDFTMKHKISERINQNFTGQLFQGKGYVVSYLLDKSDQDKLPLAASIYSGSSGRRMDVYTDQLSLQFYTGWLLDGRDIGKNDKKYKPSSGFALEAQGYTDAPNHPQFPAIVLNPGDIYYHHTKYAFSIE